MSSAACPCSSGKPFAQCCRPVLRGDSAASTATALMRSRYTAYVRGDTAYLLRTWHPTTRPATLALDDTAWRGLEILDAQAGREADAEGVVEFVAHFAQPDGTAGRLHEISRFTRVEGTWRYLDGDIR